MTAGEVADDDACSGQVVPTSDGDMAHADGTRGVALRQAIPSLADIEAARDALRPHLLATPLRTSPDLDAATGGRIFIKPECQQRKGAFKFRGAFNAARKVERDQYPGGVVACSSGNHAQGVAEAARLLGLRSQIVMPGDAPAIKVRGVREAGGEVIPYNRLTEDRAAIAQSIAARDRAFFIPPYDQRDVIAGQGTVGLEILDELEAAEPPADADAVLVPVGGGGLISGITLAMQSLDPNLAIVPVEPIGHDDFIRSLAAGERLATDLHDGRQRSPLCDALLSPMPGAVTFEICKARLSQGCVVDDAAVMVAMRFAFERLKLAVEPGGAVALAALLSGVFDARGKTVVVVLSGGNVDAPVFRRCLELDDRHLPEVLLGAQLATHGQDTGLNGASASGQSH